MSQETEIKKRVERELKTEIDVFQAAQFATGTLTSGQVTSGLNLIQVESPVKLRLLNLEMYNTEAGFIELEFRDGNISTGPRVLGPYKLNSRSEKRLDYPQVVGRYCTSALLACLVSGYTATPLSTGVIITASFVKDVIEPII